MTATRTGIYKAATSIIRTGGTAVTALYGPLDGGMIFNPAVATDQGIAAIEPIYVDVTGAEATLFESATTAEIQPGQRFDIPRGQTTNVSVNAATSGHKFNAIAYQKAPPFPPTPQPGNFPPAGPTTVTQVIPSYLYWQYIGDDALQAFVDSFNSLAQQYIAWFASGNLPVYTDPGITADLLNWVAKGLYGFERPSLASGANRDLGPLNTYGFNQFVPLNSRKVIGPQNVTVTSDDIFKRIITWNFYKGDGYIFNAKWLKRRIMRFLLGPDGSAPNIDQTYPVSVTFGAGNLVSIRINSGSRVVTGGSLPNRFGFNEFMPLNTLLTRFTPNTNVLPYQTVLKEAIETGVLQLPLQYTFTIAA